MQNWLKIGSSKSSVVVFPTISPTALTTMCKSTAPVDFLEQPSQIAGMKYRVVIEPDEDGVFVAECPSLPGCISQGKTRAEALANIKDAMTGYLASLAKHGEPVPPPINEEIVEIPA
jgi:predicted RNase H-like HicB family nuclease